MLNMVAPTVSRPGTIKAVRRIAGWILRGAQAIGLIFAAVTFTPVLTPWITLLRSPWSEARGDVLIVLGGDSTSGLILGQSSYWRAVYGVYEWRAGGVKRIVLSGAGGIAESMRDFMVAHHVPADIIRLETESHTTRDQAILVSRMLRDTPGNKVLLTSDYHSLRAYGAFRKSGLDVIPRPLPDAGKRIGTLRMRWDVFVELSRETVKLAWYRFRGWA